MSTAPTTPAARLRAIVSGSIGNFVEYYDWYAYSAFALYFSKAFFPGSDPTAQLLNTAGIFALGFFMRPLGGWLMGSLADRRGRRTTGCDRSAVRAAIGCVRRATRCRSGVEVT